ncbi:MAG: hypothetical protein EOP56_17295 [Sphingobacteriales bacterium]|nr:MAG: hypothetical protein EOP56_17295 [Sphingobacteriales bacterium]
MKKLTLLVGALMIAGASFACDGHGKKACCKKDAAKKECCKKGEKKDCAKGDAAKKDNGSTSEKKAS